MLSCLIYLTLTFLVPLRLTYQALKASSDPLHTKLWSSYWAIYSFLLLTKSVFTFLTYQPFEFALLLFHLWLFSEQYQGALFLTALITKKFEEFHFDTYVKQLGDKLNFLNIFEDRSRQAETSPKIRKVE